jgi:rhodanese-related sulfurtransferase
MGDLDPVYAPPLERLAPHDDALQVPRSLGESGRFEVDARWGTVQPVELAAGVRTVGELELIRHVRRGLPLLDTRLAHFFADGTIPTARNVPHDGIGERIDELDREVPTVLFCNGPQCTATPDAIRALLAAGYPPGALRYYRGGMHDWVTLGYPVVPGR